LTEGSCRCTLVVTVYSTVALTVAVSNLLHLADDSRRACLNAERLFVLEGAAFNAFYT
jgi:hypothetical protein